MAPSAYQLAAHFSSKLSHPTNSLPLPTLNDCHTSLLLQFRIKVSHVKCILSSLDTAKSIGDDNVSPYVLKLCSSALCGPLTALFQRICYSSTFPTSWKISRVTPIYKKGACSDPANYCPIAVLPTLSRVFEQLLMTQLQRPILLHIPPEQFSFLKGSSTSDAGVSLASTITTAINH